MAANNDMSQSVHADFLPDCQRRPSTPDCPIRRPVDNYASLGRRPATASSKLTSSVYSNGESSRKKASGTNEEFHLQIGMQVLCTGELGKLDP